MKSKTPFSQTILPSKAQISPAIWKEMPMSRSFVFFDRLLRKTYNASMIHSATAKMTMWIQKPILMFSFWFRR